MKQLFVNTQQHKWSQNAVVGGNYTYKYSYSIGYLEAGNVLVEHAISINPPLKDRLFYPLCHNYRQFIELTLKELIITAEKFYKKSESLGYQKKILHTTYSDKLNDTHSLERLLNFLIAILECIADEQFDEDVKKLIVEFHNIDPFNQKFRYPTSTQNIKSFPTQTSYDLVKLKEGLEKIANYFMGIDGYIDYYDSIANDIISSIT